MGVLSGSGEHTLFPDISRFSWYAKFSV